MSTSKVDEHDKEDDDDHATRDDGPITQLDGMVDLAGRSPAT